MKPPEFMGFLFDLKIILVKHLSKTFQGQNRENRGLFIESSGKF